MIGQIYLDQIKDLVENGDFYDTIYVDLGRHATIYQIIFQCYNDEGDCVYFSTEVESFLEDDDIYFEDIKDDLIMVEKVKVKKMVWQEVKNG